MKLQYDMDRYYTADEVNEIIRGGWKNIDEYKQMFNFIVNCKMTEKEVNKLNDGGYVDFFLSCPENKYLDNIDDIFE